VEKLSYGTVMQIIETLDPVALLDKHGKYLYVNKQWMEHCNYPESDIEKLYGLYGWEVIPDTRLKEVLKTRSPLLGEIITVSGKKACVSYYPMFKDEQFLGVLMWTVFRGIESAKKAMKMVEQLSEQLKKAQMDLQILSDSGNGLSDIVGNSSAVKKLKEEIIGAARTNSTVLIEGETGTGKELTALAIHNLGRKKTGRFVPINCAAIPLDLTESEFFGYEEGSFTGARKGGRIGKFELADKGTLFLDEINQLSPFIQPKLLRALQSREIERVGGNTSIPVDIRCISATNMPLEKMVASGAFRQDLFYRLNVVKIKVPSLRERKDDIPLLAQSMIERLNTQMQMDIAIIDDAALELLMDYSWPGNIRELQNVLESAMNRAFGGVLERKHFDFLQDILIHKDDQILQSDTQFSGYSGTLKAAQTELEEQIIINALENSRGNKAETARKLGISRSILYKKMQQFGLL